MSTILPKIVSVNAFQRALAISVYHVHLVKNLHLMKAEHVSIYIHRKGVVHQWWILAMITALQLLTLDIHANVWKMTKMRESVFHVQQVCVCCIQYAQWATPVLAVS